MSLSPGASVGRYEILGPVGAGGMGEVYRARDSRLGRQVAVKVLAGGWSLEAAHLGRFEQEARATAALNHPHILAIYDIGTHDGLPYIVTELLAGETLRERVARGPLPPATAVEIAAQIAEGLAAAHEQGIVHRDLKPENILVSGDDHATILDFGLARFRESAGDTLDTTAWQTPAGTVLGTLGYMAPELLRGNGVDHRADLFAFGAVLYEMLTGVRAFGGRSSIEAMAAILDHQVASPSQGNPAVSIQLGEIVRQCLEKNPDRRFQSARAVVLALRTLGDSAQPAGEDAGVTGRHSRVVPSIAVLPFVDMSSSKDQDYFCEGIAEEITNTLAHASGLRVVARTSAFRFKGQARDVREIGNALGATAVLEGSIRAVGQRIRITVQLVDTKAGFQIWSDRFDGDLGDVLALQDDISRRVAESLSAKLGTALAGRTADPEAHTLYLKGRYHWNKRTEADLEESVQYFRRALAVDPGYAHAHSGMADALLTLGIYGVRSPAEVIEAARAAAHVAMRLAPDLAGAHACLGCIEGLHDRAWDAAVRSLQRAIDLNPDDGQLRQWYATNALVPLGRFDEALRELRLAQALDPLSLPIRTSIGITLYYARRFDEAADALADTCRLENRFGLAHLFLGFTCAARLKFEDALREVEIAVQTGGRTPENLSGLGFLASVAGDTARGRSLLDELVAASARRYVSPVLIAQLYAGLGDSPQALVELERAREVRALDLVWARSRHTFDSLRDEPRFQSAVGRAMDAD